MHTTFHGSGQIGSKVCKYIKKKVITHTTQNIDIFSSDSDEKYFFLFNERLQKFQKRAKVFLSKLFPSLDYPYTLD